MKFTTLTDVERLITDKKAEDSHIEYKLESKVSNTKEKKEFLYDVSSFANKNGGIILYGIKAGKGIPVSIEGISLSSADDLILQLESMIRTGITPRILDSSEKELRKYVP